MIRTPGYRQISLALLVLVLFWAFSSKILPPPGPDFNYGVLSTTKPTSKIAIATFLSGDPEIADKNDDYFRAARLMTYQLVHAPETRASANISFIVLVTKDVPEWKREQLTKDGAQVVVAEDVPLNWWISTGVSRWKDQFTKLRLLEMVEYERILFVDADTLIIKPLDGIFNQTIVTQPAKTKWERTKQIYRDEAQLPTTYVFGARSDNQFLGARKHSHPLGHTEVFTAGFWIAAPSKELYTYLMSVMTHWRRFDPHTMEQSLLNYAFRPEGAMPWIELDEKWSSTWPNKGDLDAGIASLHEKFWKTGPKELRELYLKKRKESEEYFKKHSS